MLERTVGSTIRNIHRILLGDEINEGEMGVVCNVRQR